MAGRNFDQINYPTNITNPATFAVLLRAIEELGSIHSSEASKSIFPKARAAVGRFNAENNDTHGEGTLKTYGLIEYITTSGDAEFKVSYLGKRLLELYEKNKDTKYKGISRFETSTDIRKTLKKEINQGDLYQMISYAVRRGVSDIYLLYPLYRYEDNEPYYPVASINQSNGTKIQIHLIRLPFVFEEDIEKTKESLKKCIISMFD